MNRHRLALLVVFMLAGGSYALTAKALADQPKVNNRVPPIDKDAVKAIVSKEQKVIDSVVNDAGVLYAGVKSDGTARDGYAMYLCEVVRGTGVHRVRVVDIASVRRAQSPQDWVIMGENWC